MIISRPTYRILFIGRGEATKCVAYELLENGEERSVRRVPGVYASQDECVAAIREHANRNRVEEVDPRILYAE